MSERVKCSARSRMTTLNQSKARGFTLIELLVVIAIIAILSSVVLASLSAARTKARDARRAADMNQILTALNLYYDQYGCLPTTDTPSPCRPAGSTYLEGNGGGWDYSSQTGNAGASTYDQNSATFMKFLVEAGYMSRVPVDPVNNMDDNNITGTKYAYRYYCYPGSPYGVTLVYWKEFPVRTGVVVLQNSATPEGQNFVCK